MFLFIFSMEAIIFHNLSLPIQICISGLGYSVRFFWSVYLAARQLAKFGGVTPS